MIQPVIIEVQSQRESVRKLVHYIKQLDGTEVKVIPLTPEDDAAFFPRYPENAKACRAAFSLNHAALTMKGKPFIWLEPDATPLKPGWVKALSDEYERLGKPFMLSGDSNPPGDLVGGIGVYSGDTHWMIPQHLRTEPARAIGWDLWMIRNLAPLISKTPLIQHSYGTYNSDYIARDHTFPRDAHLLRKDAVIFHRCVDGSLMNKSNRIPASKTFYHSGDLGDIIYHLETIRRLGGGKLILGSDLGLGPKLPSRCRESMTLSRFENIKPLIVTQPYISGVEHFEGKPDKSWINLNAFREVFKPTKKSPTCESLQRASLRRFGLLVQDETQPWLTVAGGHHAYPIVVARSTRYHNDDFPWKELLQRFNVLFVGTEDEHTQLYKLGPSDHLITKDLWELARAINGAKVFIGNQSCPYAIAEGLKKPCIQESWDEPNCLFQRPNVLNMTTDFDRISKFIEGYL